MQITGTSVQKRLLAEKDLALDKAIALVRAVEIAEKGAKDLQNQHPQVQTSISSAREVPCLLKTNLGKLTSIIQYAIVVVVSTLLPTADSSMKIAAYVENGDI